MSIRPETPGDHARVFAIHAAAFGRRNEAELVEALRAAVRPCLSLVAEGEGGVLGHVLLSPVTLEPSSPAVSLAGLAPVGVDPARQGRGLGSALVRAALERAPALGWRAVFLVGSPAWYPRFGFVPAAPLGFTYGDPAIDPALQACALEPDALAGLGGRVCFHRAFVETGCG